MSITCIIRAYNEAIVGKGAQRRAHAFTRRNFRTIRSRLPPNCQATTQIFDGLLNSTAGRRLWQPRLA
jgi:hypothetical protein